MLAEKHRCAWGQTSNDLMREYHDEEWGRPSHDSRHLFELLSLEIMQAGLSWQTVLNKRAAFKQAFLLTLTIGRCSRWHRRFLCS